MEEVNRTKTLTPQGLNRCILQIVKDAGGSLDITCDELDALSRSETVKVEYDAEKDAFHFEAIKVEKDKVLQPSRKLILPR